MTDPQLPADTERRRRGPWRRDLYRVIFEADSARGKLFDIALLGAISLSVIAVMLESVPAIRDDHGDALRTFEWVVTAVFTIEYILRLVAAARPLRYVTSFFGVVDLLALLPTYLSIFFAGTHSLLIIRALRLLRVFRVLKLAQYVGEARLLVAALKSSSRKIFIFLGTVFTIQLIVGSLMYLIEGEESGFTSIPQGVYWAIVTMTTVGYGDITPITPIGKLLAACVMITGFGIIAVPTGLVVSELGHARRETSSRCCSECMGEGHDEDAEFCKYCGAGLTIQ